MRLATACYGFREWTIENYLYAAGGLGVGSVEIGYTKNGTLHELCQPPLNLRGEDRIAYLRHLAENAGVRMFSCVRNYQLWGVNDTWMETARASIRLDIEIGAKLGLEVLRVTEIGYPYDVPEEEVFDQVVQVGSVLNELAEHAEAHGVVIVTENFRASSNLMSAIAAQFTSPAVGLHYDPHNFCRVGEDPVKALRKIKDHVKYVHFKDYRQEDGQRLPTDTWWPSWAVGAGEIEWRSILTELSTFYNGVVAIEYEKHLGDVVLGMNESINFVRQTAEACNIELT